MTNLINQILSLLRIRKPRKEKIPSINLLNFDEQHLVISDEHYTVTLYTGKNVEQFNFRRLGAESTMFGSNEIVIQTSNDEGGKDAIILSVGGGFYLHSASETGTAQSVKIWDGCIVMSLDIRLISVELSTLTIRWETELDGFPMYEFYDLENDILLRSELMIYRINSSGEVIWRFGGRDIWVNINGKKEVVIMPDRIRLTDFESNEYLIDYNGKLIEDIREIRNN